MTSPTLWSAVFLSLTFAFAASLSAAFPTPTNNQPETTPLLSPHESLSKMKLPPGFEATVFAAEPDIQNPIALCWDEGGRLWVAENHTYSNSKERFDLKLRDRILIFEDADNDGRFDKRTVFADDLQMLTSIERGFGGVYALCPPRLLWIPTQDDKPSGPPQVLLDGFSTTAASRHTFANGLKWGPDGWLYGRIGISSTSWIDVPGIPREQRQPTAGGIWRYHPTRKIYEPYCHGTTNPWGMDWNSSGDLFFVNTVIGHLWHAVPGAHFKRMHGEDPYDHIYGLMDQIADHHHWDTGSSWTKSGRGDSASDALGGGHSHIGMTIYQGTNWPAEYRGKVLTFNQHGRRLNVERLERQGSGYVAKHEPDILKSDDPWLRVIEVSYGPDGGVYLLDWSDIGECHDDDGVHRTSGRIYKIAYGKPSKPPESDLHRLNDEDLVKLQLSDNEWLVRMARWELRERKYDARLSLEGQKAFESFPAKDAPVGHRLNALWLEAYLGPAASLRSTEADLDDADIRSARLRLWVGDVPSENVADHFDLSPASLKRLENISAAETSAKVLLTWATLLPRLPAPARLALGRGLLSYEAGAADRNLPLMIWYGIRQLPPADLADLFPSCRIPLVSQFIARRLAEDIEKAPAPLNTLLQLAAKTGDPATRSDILTGLATSLKGWRKAPKPSAWDAFAETFAETKDVSVTNQMRDLALVFGDGHDLAKLRDLALDSKADTGARTSALHALAEAKSPDLRSVGEKLIWDRSVGLEAVRALGVLDDSAVAETILNAWGNFYPHERGAVGDVLVSRPSFARALLKRVAAGKIPRSELTATHARQIRAFGDEALTKLLTETWGEARESAEDKSQLIKTLRAKLTPETLAKGDASQGRVLHNALCAPCHKLYGEGGNLGPDLTGGGRHDLGYLLENIADPSAIVAAELRLNLVTLKDGRVLSGLIRNRTERTLTLVSIGQEQTLDRSDIVKQEQLPNSLMPEGLLNGLNDTQLRDLFTYLMSKGQVSLPK